MWKGNRMSNTDSIIERRTISEALEQNLHGYTIGRRLSLPFHADLISIIVGKQISHFGGPDVITDFSPSQNEVLAVVHENRTDLYFEKYSSLQSELGHWKGTLIITCCGDSDDLFDETKHRRLVFTF
jgi:hypothetical protein